MNFQRFIISGVLCCLQFALFAQGKDLSQEIMRYIETYRGIAQEEMLRSGVPASITLAQGIHESNIGKSVLATEAKNHFGIKCHKEWTGPGYTYDDDAKGECFRVYESAIHSYRDHSDFLTSRPRYASLFTLDRKDYKGWASGLKAAGYATNPKYPEIIVRLIEEYSLQQYDEFSGAVYAEKKEAEKPAPVQPQVDAAPEVVSFAEIGSHNGIPSVLLERAAKPAEVAAHYSVPLKSLLAYNDMDEGDVFRANDRVYFAEKKKIGASSFHTVAHGENMWSIAQQHGIKLQKLYERNKMRMNDQPMAGESIYLQERRISAPSTMSYEAYLKSVSQTKNVTSADVAKPAFEAQTVTASVEKIYTPVTSKIAVEAVEYSNNFNDDGTRYYVVEPKETLYAISRMFGVSVEQLKNWNNLAGNEIKVGQMLIVRKP